MGKTGTPWRGPSATKKGGKVVRTEFGSEWAVVGQGVREVWAVTLLIFEAPTGAGLHQELSQVQLGAPRLRRCRFFPRLESALARKGRAARRVVVAGVDVHRLWSRGRRQQVTAGKQGALGRVVTAPGASP